MFRNHNSFSGDLSDAIDKIIEGDSSYLYAAYCVLPLGNPYLVKRCGCAIRQLLQGYSVRKIIRIGEQFRQHSFWEWSINWTDINLKRLKEQFGSEDDYIYALILGSFHPNGYFRETCLCEMVEYPDTLPYLVLRLNDWVSNIRARAFSLSTVKMRTCLLSELLLTTPVLDKLRRAGRRDNSQLREIEDFIRTRTNDEIVRIPLTSISGYDFDTRKGILRLLFSEKTLPMADANALLNLEKHSFCQQLIITGIISYYDCPVSQLDEYLHHKSAVVRRKVLEHKYEIVKDTWPGLEKVLLDANYGIRQFACFILQQHSGLDIKEFYLAHLSDSDPTIAILGVGENGDRESAQRLMPFLEDPAAKVLRAAIHSVAKLVGMDGDDLYWTYLRHGERSVSKAAYLAIRSNNIHYGAERLYRELRNCGFPHVNRYLVILLIHEKFWERLPCLIELYQDESLAAFKDQMLEAMWSQNLYARISKEQGQYIRSVLERNQEYLPARLVSSIQFDLGYVVVE